MITACVTATTEGVISGVPYYILCHFPLLNQRATHARLAPTEQTINVLLEMLIGEGSHRARLISGWNGRVVRPGRPNFL